MLSFASYPTHSNIIEAYPLHRNHHLLLSAGCILKKVCFACSEFPGSSDGCCNRSITACRYILCVQPAVKIIYVMSKKPLSGTCHCSLPHAQAGNA
jgi:hypothetical protein